jgi:hypothetical protein
MSEGRHHLSIEVSIWVDHQDPRVVHLVTNDDRFVLPGSTKGPGLHLAFNDNPLSANYHPVALKRCLSALQSHGMDVIDLESVFTRDRHIAKRERVIDEWHRTQEPRAEVGLVMEVPFTQARDANAILARAREVIENGDPAEIARFLEG